MSEDIPSFAKDFLVKVPEAKVLHFEPNKDGRDRFGNRIFSSPDLAYKDREGDLNKALLLVSPEGEEFIKTNSGILQDIQEGLSSLGETLNPNIVKTFKRDRSIKGLNFGGQSFVYVLKIGGEKYVLKKARQGQIRGDDVQADVTQPYINEMLQTQAIAIDLASELSEMKVETQKFLFASGQMSCTRFEVGDYPKISLSDDRLVRLDNLVTTYILKQQQSGNKLWKSIHLDLKTWNNHFKDSNFIEKDDGTLVWIDMLYYSK